MVSQIPGGDNLEPAIRKLRNLIKDEMIEYKAHRYFTKPSETKRREKERTEKRFKRPQPIKAYKEMGNQKMVRFTKHEQQKYV